MKCAKKFLFYISGENTSLAKQEIRVLGKTSYLRRFGRVVVATSKGFNFNRLAMTSQVSRFLFCSLRRNLEKKVEVYDWEALCRKSFAVRVKGAPAEMEKRLANIIWRKLGNPKVNLSSPDVQINFYFCNNRVFCGVLICSLSRDFENRKPHLRPGFHPTSLSPKIAAAMINLTGAEKSVWDPFCGTGGILIEAGLMGLRVIGSDIDMAMLERAQANLKFCRVKNYKLVAGDAMKLSIKAEAIVSDLPYGKGSILVKSSSSDINRFYSDFIKRAVALVGKGRVAVMVPSNARIKVASSFETEIYVHKSLTRRLMLF